jgi:hypothetical protein
MATWTGWVAQFTNAANIKNNAGTQRWFDDWSTHNTAACKNNPIDLSRKQGSSSNCKKLTGSRTAQNYATHSQAAAAFNNQLHSGNFPNLLSTLKDGIYPAGQRLGDVMSDLQTWGATEFVKWLEAEFGIAPGGGGVGGGNTFTAPFTTSSSH